jgi:hypothetical protein
MKETLEFKKAMDKQRLVLEQSEGFGALSPNRQQELIYTAAINQLTDKREAEINRFIAACHKANWTPRRIERAVKTKYGVRHEK